MRNHIASEQIDMVMVERNLARLNEETANGLEWTRKCSLVGEFSNMFWRNSYKAG